MLTPKEKKEKKSASISMRVPFSVLEMLREITESYNMSQAEVFERMIRAEFDIMKTKLYEVTNI
jgi:hypothetical protein